MVVTNWQAIWRAIVDCIPTLSHAIPVSFYPPNALSRPGLAKGQCARESARPGILGQGRGKTCRTGVGTCGGIGSPSSFSRLKTASRSSRLPFLLPSGGILTSILPFHTRAVYYYKNGPRARISPSFLRHFVFYGLKCTQQRKHIVGHTLGSSSNALRALHEIF